MRRFFDVSAEYMTTVPWETWHALGNAVVADVREICGVTGLICAIEAWHKWRLARALLRTHHRARCDAMEGKRYIAEIESLPNCVAYGDTEDEAKENARKLGVCILLDRARAGEPL